MEPGTRIGRFEILRTLGQGGIATVYQVRHTQLLTIHALKLLRLSHPSMARRLLQEGRIQARLQHPNVVSVTDVVEHEGGIGLLMEYVEGFSLEEALAGGPMSLEDALATFRQVLAGVGAAHAAGVTHRDLKPANILLTVQQDRVVAKVTDFGIAKLLREDSEPGMTRAGVTMGTPGYMAPEQISDSAAVDHRADVFALGAILYEMIAGEPAFRGSNMLDTMNRTASGTYTALDERVPGTPLAVCEAIGRALSPDRGARFQDCRAFAQALYDDADLVPAPAVFAEPEPEADPRSVFTSSAAAAATTLPSTLPTPAPTLAPALEGLDLGEDPPTDAARGPRSAPTFDVDTLGTDETDETDETGETGETEEVPDRDPEPEPAQPPPPLPETEGMDARDASQMMGELFWTMARATLYGVAKAVQYGGVPFLLVFSLTWFQGQRVANQMVHLSEAEKSQGLVLERAMGSNQGIVAELVAAGANPAMIASQRSRYEEATTVESKAQAALEYSGILGDQIAHMPAFQDPALAAHRRELELSLAALDREAQRYADLERDRTALENTSAAAAPGCCTSGPRPAERPRVGAGPCRRAGRCRASRSCPPPSSSVRCASPTGSRRPTGSGSPRSPTCSRTPTAPCPSRSATGCWAGPGAATASPRPAPSTSRPRARPGPVSWACAATPTRPR